MSKFTVSIIGFGAFGQLMARHLRRHCAVVIHDVRAVKTDLPCVSLAQAAEADVVILAVPVCDMALVLRAMIPHLRPGAVVMDVASLKEEPAQMMMTLLPPHVEVIATHPLFGPQSAAKGIVGHRVAWCPLRGRAHRRIAAFLRHVGIRIVRTSPTAHDRDMAVVQGLTHLIAQSLTHIGPLPRQLATHSFQHLLDMMQMVGQDTPQLRHTILHHNPYARHIRRLFLDAAAHVGQDMTT